MSPQTRVRYEDSLGSMESLVDEVRSRLADTDDPELVYDELRDLMLELRTIGRQREEDMVTDVMDLLSGWGNPENWLVPPDRVVRR